jgi:hypothetical protein
MLTAPSQIEETCNSSRNTLPRRSARNSIGLLHYRSDYELRSLRLVREGIKRARKGMIHAIDAATFAIYSRELDRLIERERILLRIPLPQAAKAPEPRSVRGRASNLIVEEPIDAGPTSASTDASASEGTNSMQGTNSVQSPTPTSAPTSSTGV